jgi:xanthine dehydrogenase YagS FAD-binding subunit
MKEDVERPTTLVDLTRLKLADIVPSSAGVSIGALATNSNTANHSFIRRTIRTSRKP